MSEQTFRRPALPATGCAAFDRQAHAADGYYGTGNVWATTQFSNFIRPWDETKCNGFDFAPGHLQDCDMRPYRELRHTFALDIRHAVDRAGGGILYRIQHFVPARYPRLARHVIHGYILTDKQDHVLRVLHVSSDGSKRSRRVLDTFAAWLEPQQVKQAA